MLSRPHDKGNFPLKLTKQHRPQDDDLFRNASETKEISRWLQLTVAGVRDAMSLECFYGRTGLSFEFVLQVMHDALLCNAPSGCTGRTFLAPVLDFA